VSGSRDGGELGAEGAHVFFLPSGCAFLRGGFHPRRQKFHTARFDTEHDTRHAFFKLQAPQENLFSDWNFFHGRHKFLWPLHVTI